MGLSVGNSGGASTELGSGIPSYMSRVSMVSVSNGLLSIPNDQQLVFEDGVPYLRQANQVVDMEHQSCLFPSDYLSAKVWRKVSLSKQD